MTDADSQPQASSQDLEHLSLLVAFHYVVAGLLVLVGSFPIFHLVMGLSILFRPELVGGADQSGMPIAIFGLMFTLIPIGIIGLFWTIAGLTVRAGRCMKRRQSHTFCVVMAAVVCCFVPFGTVLGVLSLLVLMRPGVKALFVQADAQAAVF